MSTSPNGREERHPLESGPDSKLSPREFTLRGIEKLRPAPGKGVHVVYSGFNAAFRAYFPDLDPVQVMNQLAAEGVIRIIPVRGGVAINTLNGVHHCTPAGKKALAKMGLV